MENTIRIALCDDEKRVFLWMEGMLQHYMEARGQKYEFCYYADGEKFLAAAESFSLVFLDVELPGIDGFFIAEELRRRKLKLEIIYLTNHGEMARQAFRVKALRYLQKPCIQDEWIEAMEAALYELSGNRVLEIEVPSGAVYFEDICQIMYMEALGDESCIYLQEGYLISGKPLKYWEAELSGEFFRCHKSYLVNLGAVECCEEKSLLLKSGKKIPLAYRKRKSVKQTVYQYRRKKARFY